MPLSLDGPDTWISTNRTKSNHTARARAHHHYDVHDTNLLSGSFNDVNVRDGTRAMHNAPALGYLGKLSGDM